MAGGRVGPGQLTGQVGPFRVGWKFGRETRLELAGGQSECHKPCCRELGSYWHLACPWENLFKLWLDLECSVGDISSTPGSAVSTFPPPALVECPSLCLEPDALVFYLRIRNNPKETRDNQTL